MKNPVRPSSCVTPAGTSNELDVQNEWEENKHTRAEDRGHRSQRNQIEDALGSSWAALAAEEDPQGRGIGTLLVEAGVGGGGEGGGGGGVGAGVLDSENNGRIRWQPSQIGRLS